MDFFLSFTLRVYLCVKINLTMPLHPYKPSCYITAIRPSQGLLCSDTVAVPAQSFTKSPRHAQSVYKWGTTGRDLSQTPLQCVKDILILAPTLTHQQYVHHRTCTITSCINALPLSHSIIEQSFQTNRKRKKSGLEARYLGQ